ncbi:MAG: DNRLRE domain-containing protein [Fibrobacterales bacterium]
MLCLHFYQRFPIKPFQLLVLALILFVCCSVNNSADSNSITGIVIVGGNPAAAKVSLVRSDDKHTIVQEVYTNADGTYAFTDVPADSFIIVTTIDWEYGNVSDNLLISEDSEIILNIDLAPFKNHPHEFADTTAQVSFYSIPITDYSSEKQLYYLDSTENIYQVTSPNTTQEFAIINQNGTPSVVEVQPTIQISSSSSLLLISSVQNDQTNDDGIQPSSSAELITIIIQPGTNEAQDTYISAQKTGATQPLVPDNINYGNAEFLHLGANFPTLYRTLLAFDLSPIPSNAIISSATLTVTTQNTASYAHAQGRDSNILIHKLLKSWNGGTADTHANNSLIIDGVTSSERYWGAQDESEDWTQGFIGLDNIDASTHAYSTITPAIMDASNSFGIHFIFPIKELAQEWVNSPSDNFGMLLRTWSLSISEETNGLHSNGEEFDFTLFSSKAENPSVRPKLEIMYSLDSSNTVITESSNLLSSSVMAPLSSSDVSISTEEIEITIQPGPETGKDGHVYADWRNDSPTTIDTTPYGTEEILELGGISGTLARALISFDLNEIPPDALIISAQLILKVDVYGKDPGESITQFSLTAHKLLQEWTQASLLIPLYTTGVTTESGEYYIGQNTEYATERAYSTISMASNPSNEYFTNQTDSYFINPSNDYLTFPLTELVQEWVTLPSENFGMALRSWSPDLTTDDLNLFFKVWASEAPIAEDRPKLEIAYTLSN